ITKRILIRWLATPPIDGPNPIAGRERLTTKSRIINSDGLRRCLTMDSSKTLSVFFENCFKIEKRRKCPRIPSRMAPNKIAKDTSNPSKFFKKPFMFINNPPLSFIHYSTKSLFKNQQLFGAGLFASKFIDLCKQNSPGTEAVIPAFAGMTEK
ncbi:MAG: hypothetical protein KJ984_03270, partial [Nanoarchaeota archaeon]|nr:hypothetical protein [Nanoarchaeota archaeon]